MENFETVQQNAYLSDKAYIDYTLDNVGQAIEQDSPWLCMLYPVIRVIITVSMG